MKRSIKILLSMLLIVIMAISSIIVFKNKKEDHKEEKIIEQVIDTAYKKDDIENTQMNNLQENNINMNKLYEQNEDIVAWIKIDNSNINYPVMQTIKNPNYYLRKNFYKEYSYYGTPYLSEQCNINSSDNLIIYGHHIKGFKMFGELEHYKNKEYYDKHKTINIYTLNDERKYEIIYVFRTFTNTKFDYYNYINFNDESEFNTFNSKCKELAFFDTQIQCNYGDKFITLSTCDYTSENARFVVIAKQIIENNNEEMQEEQDNIEKNTIEKSIPKEETIKKSDSAKTSNYNKNYFKDGHLINYPSFLEKYATLKINKLNINAPIYFGATDDILSKGIAHDSGSYFAGENGSIIMCGHNYMNNFTRLRRIKNRRLYRNHYRIWRFLL